MPPQTSVETCRSMLRNLLAERFHMVTGVETRDVYRYFVKRAKSGVKLKSVDEPPAGHQARNSTIVDGQIRFTFDAASMRTIVAFVGSYVLLNTVKRLRISIADIVDETGLAG